MIEVLVDVGSFAWIEPEAVRLVGRRALLSRGVAVGELSVTFVDDDAIRALNRRYLEHDYVTDVISFPLYEAGRPLVGEVCIGAQQAERQAEEQGVPLAEEVVRLVIHGALHVTGLEHPEGSERLQSPFFAAQEALVKAALDAGEVR